MELTRDTLLEMVQSELLKRKLSISSLEKQSGLAKDTIRDFLRGKTWLLRSDKLQKLLAFLQPASTIAVEEYVGENARIFPLLTEKYGEVECPPGFNPLHIKAVIIAGDAMLPVFHNGWILYYSSQDIPYVPLPSEGWQVPYNRPISGDKFAEFMGKPCIITLKDGSRMLRTLKTALTPGRYDLISYNAPDIRDAEIESASKIVFIRT